MDEKKQIEEMARIVSKCITSWLNNETPKVLPDYVAEALYNADYRKQSVGEWNEKLIGFCNVCMSCGAIVERSAIKNNSGKLNFCPNCGAMMKGGAEE